MQKLNHEIDTHLKQPDDNKFATLKVNIAFNWNECCFNNIIFFRVIIGIWLVNYYQYGNVNLLNMKNENEKSMKAIHKIYKKTIS
jgi:hypothetical protein